VLRIVEDRIGEDHAVCQAYDPARILVVLNPLADLHDRRPQQADVEDVPHYVAYSYPVADPEYVPGDDIQIAGKGAYHLLRGKGNAGAEDPDNGGEVASEFKDDRKHDHGGGNVRDLADKHGQGVHLGYVPYAFLEDPPG